MTIRFLCDNKGCGNEQNQDADYQPWGYQYRPPKNWSVELISGTNKHFCSPRCKKEYHERFDPEPPAAA